MSENNCPTPKGCLLIIGGHENKDKNDEQTEILKKFVNLAGDKDAIIEVITSASSEGDESFQPYLDIFTHLGARHVGHIHHEKRKDVLDNDYKERLNNATGVFFAGGDQLKLTSVYGGTRLLTRLKERYIDEPVVVAGTSAGAMAMSTPMIYAGSKEDQLLTGNVKVTTGLEFLKDVCVDTHFVDRGRFVRMAQVIATNPTSIGLGVEEDTALLITDGLHAKVIGSGVVIVIEGFRITDSDITEFQEQQPVFIDNLTVRILAKDNQYMIPQNNPPHR
jgi:cyanophycinase